MAVGRFQVMATLQAARAYVMGLPLESAYSWGLNRSIFYAAAKRGFRGGGATTAHASQWHEHPTGGAAHVPGAEEYYLGEEMAYKSDEPGALRFTIGGKTQTKQDFERQVEFRFQGKFKDAWEEALDYVRQFDKATLRSGTEFFSSVYRPKRDEFAAKWTEMAAESKPEKKEKRTERAVTAPVHAKRRVVRPSR